jgi:plastocyanin
MALRLAALAALGAACVFSTAAAETIRVSINKLSFAPKEISAHVGDTIEWSNSDFVAHTATARNKDWDVAVPVKGVAQITLTHSGDVDYFCRFHPNMTGHIAVTP